MYVSPHTSPLGGAINLSLTLDVLWSKINEQKNYITVHPFCMLACTFGLVSSTAIMFESILLCYTIQDDSNWLFGGKKKGNEVNADSGPASNDSRIEVRMFHTLIFSSYIDS